MTKNSVFISYAREDARYAERLYMDLRAREIDAWLDTRRLLPGQNWRSEISRAIRGSRYFMALISTHSLSKRGVVQTEMKRAIQVMSEMPSDQIFLVPVRLDECLPADEQLQNLNWVDLFPNYQHGLERILLLLKDAPKTPLEHQTSSTGRVPINYAPHCSFADFARDLIERLPSNNSMADPEYAMYIRYRSSAQGVVLPPAVLAKFPDEITIVLQHQFHALTANREGFSVVLWFSGKPETLSIPYSALREIVVPTIGLRVEHFGVNAT